MTAVYLFAGILAVLLVVVLVAPLLDSQPSPGARTDPAARLDAALEALRDLEFEHETGKVEEEDYRRLRARYAAEAVEARDAGAGDLGPDEAADRALCAVCEAPLAAGARFCSRCGTAVEGEGAREPRT
ncbi:MAG: hypothetical protein ACODAA_01080 [Gemmatimonadota bacterium]